jgi:RHS repeat-associated protein
MRYFCLHLKYTINKQMGAFKLDYGNYFYCTKKCNKSNHLGNVLTLFTDKKIPVGTAGTVSYYKADLVSSMDYSPFGAPLKGRTFNGSGSRYGFNGQEKDNEISGAGNSMTAEYWQYDSRLGRRWNIDPVVKPWESSYATFANNPILFSDPNGDDVDKSNLSKDEIKRIENMINPDHETYNKEFATTYSALEGDHTAMYTYNFKGYVPYNSEATGTMVLGEVPYGGTNAAGQDIININYTYGAGHGYEHPESALLEETFHADQFRTGEIGFLIEADGSVKSLGLDKTDEARAKIRVLKSLLEMDRKPKLFSGETPLYKAHLKDAQGSFNHFIARAVGGAAYANFDNFDQTPLEAMGLEYKSEYFDKEGRFIGKLTGNKTAIFRQK